MAKAQVNMKSGAVITIEGSDREVSEILAELKSVHEDVAARNRKLSTPRRERSAGLGPMGLVLALKEAGFFDKPKTLGDIARAIEDRGYLIPTTTLSGVVLSLLRRGEVHRKKLEGQWHYGR